MDRGDHDMVGVDPRFGRNGAVSTKCVSECSSFIRDFQLGKITYNFHPTLGE